jgi:aminopeptidase YwaD
MTTRELATPVPVEGLGRLLDAVSEQRLAATVAALSSEMFAGRRVGSPGGAAARTWLIQQLADLGAAVTAESFQAKAVPEIYAAPVVDLHDGTTTTRLVFGRQVSVHLASSDVPLVRRGPLAVAGQGDPVGRWLLVPDGIDLADAYGQAQGAVGLLVARGVDRDGWQYTMLAGPVAGALRS